MSKRILAFLAAACLVVVVAPCVARAQGQTVYTYVAEFEVPRAHWAEISAENEKTSQPVLERLLKDGTLVGYGFFESLVHSPGEPTHGTWWESSTLAGITKTLDELRKASPRYPGWELASTKHWDHLLRSHVQYASPVAGASGYLRVVASLAQPGKEDALVDWLKKHIEPICEAQAKAGQLTYCAFDEQYVNTEPPSLRYAVFLYPTAEAMDKWAATAGEALGKLTPEEQAPTIPNSRRDFMARIPHYAHK